MDASHSRLAKGLAAVSIAVVLILATGCGGGASTGSSTGGSGSSGAKGGVEKGQEIFKSAKVGCSNCHKVNGQGGAVGPDLSHVATNAAKRKAGMSVEDYIEESIKNPSAFVVEGFPNAMPKLSLSDQEKDSLVAYLMSLK